MSGAGGGQQSALFCTQANAIQQNAIKSPVQSSASSSAQIKETGSTPGDTVSMSSDVSSLHSANRLRLRLAKQQLAIQSANAEAQAKAMEAMALRQKEKLVAILLENESNQDVGAPSSSSSSRPTVNNDRVRNESSRLGGIPESNRVSTPVKGEYPGSQPSAQAMPVSSPEASTLEVKVEYPQTGRTSIDEQLFDISGIDILVNEPLDPTMAWMDDDCKSGSHYDDIGPILWNLAPAVLPNAPHPTDDERQETVRLWEMRARSLEIAVQNLEESQEQLTTELQNESMQSQQSVLMESRVNLLHMELQHVHQQNIQINVSRTDESMQYSQHSIPLAEHQSLVQELHDECDYHKNEALAKHEYNQRNIQTFNAHYANEVNTVKRWIELEQEMSRKFSEAEQAAEQATAAQQLRATLAHWENMAHQLHNEAQALDRQLKESSAVFSNELDASLSTSRQELLNQVRTEMNEARQQAYDNVTFHARQEINTINNAKLHAEAALIEARNKLLAEEQTSRDNRNNATEQHT
jgi:hypothetical protein